MNRVAWTLCRWQDSLGSRGVIIVLLTAVAMAALAWTVYQRTGHIRRLKADIAVLQARSASPATSPASGLSSFAALPAASALPGIVQAMYRAGSEHGIALPRTEYQRSVDASAGIVTFRVTLPVRGSYVQLRRFIDATLASAPSLALRAVSFRRERTDVPLVDARIEFTFIARAGEAGP